MRFLIRLVVIVLVAVALAVIGLLMLPGDRIARIAADQLSKQTGRVVTISPDTSISLYPTLGVTTGPASISSAEWAKNGPLLTSNSLAIGIDVPALLGGTIRVTKLEAKSPRVILERAADGRANWEFFPSDATPTETPAATTSEDGQSFDLSLERALISDASLRYIDHGTGTDQSFENVDLDLSWPDMGGAAQVMLGVTPFTERLVLNANVADVMGLSKGAQTALRGTLQGAGANIAFEGTASIKPEAAMQINADIPRAGALLRALGQDPAALGLSGDFDPKLSVNSQVSFDGTRLALRKMALGLDASTLSGDADIVLVPDAPQVTAKLNADIKNAGQLMRMLGQTPETFGLDPAFNPSLASAVTLSLNGSNITAGLTGLTASMEEARVSGKADIALQDGTPNITADLALSLPNAARSAELLGQPLSNFGLSPSAAPALKSNVTANIKGENISATLRDLSASIAGANVSGAMDFAIAGGAPALSGNVTANIPSTANLMRALGQAAPDLPQGFGRAIKASTALSFKSNQLDLSRLTVSLDQNTFSGGVSIGLGGAVPNVNASLQAGDLDFTALSGDGGSASESSSDPSGWPKTPIDASALGAVNGNIKLTARSINLGNLQLGAADLGVAIDNSRAVISINDLRAYQGSFAGNFVANNRSGLSVGGDLRASSVALGPLLTALAGVDKIAGNGNLNVSFLGSGGSVDAIMRSLSGQVALSVPQGTISGIDLEGLIRQGNANASLTQFTNLSANGVISGGSLQNDDLTVSTGRVDAKGEGYINLGAQTLDYLITPIAKDVGSQDRIEIPVRIKGPWSNPTIRPDLEAALNLENERKKLEEQARQEIEREKQKLIDQAEAEKEKLRAKAQAEAKKLEDRARQKVEDAAKKAAERAAQQLGLDKAAQKKLENAAKNTLEKELGKGLKNLLGGN
ncbi:AsmA family protein [Planktotalea arctica]|uniref:AsmA family protein n=1 Tax=Planktotalea arctica TaxID=1481893 RepID=UPI003218F5B6